MKHEDFATLNRSWGNPIEKVGDYYFHTRRLKGFPLPVHSSFPPTRKVHVTKKLVRALKWRFLITPLLLDLPKADLYEFVLITDNYNLEQFESRVRTGIRKSLKECTFQKPSMEELLNEAMSINEQTTERQSRSIESLTDQQQWNNYIKSVYNHEGFSILGAYLEERMIGYIVVLELEGEFILNQAFIDRDYSRGTNPMAGLLYNLVNSLVEKHGSIRLSYGLHLFSRTTTLTRFKERMLFKRTTASKGYVIHPALLICIKLFVFATVKVMKRRNFQSKWAREIVRMCQGNRRLKYALRLQK